jgi:hypothetical protein
MTKFLTLYRGSFLVCVLLPTNEKITANKPCVVYVILIDLKKSPKLKRHLCSSTPSVFSTREKNVFSVCRLKTGVVHFLPLRKMKEKQAVQDLFYFIGVGIKEYEEKKPFLKL